MGRCAANGPKERGRCRRQSAAGADWARVTGAPGRREQGALIGSAEPPARPRESFPNAGGGGPRPPLHVPRCTRETPGPYVGPGSGNGAALLDLGLETRRLRTPSLRPAIRLHRLYFRKRRNLNPAPGKGTHPVAISSQIRAFPNPCGELDQLLLPSADPYFQPLAGCLHCEVRQNSSFIFASPNHRPAPPC